MADKKTIEVRRSKFLCCLVLGAWCCAFSALPRDGPLTPEEAIKTFQTEPGLRVELVACEPTVVDPVAVAWDERGRMFVVEDRGYPVGPGKGKAPVGQVVLLEDTNGDGKYDGCDKRTVFADGLTFPNGVMPWNGGVYVTCAPNLHYFKDTDGDGVADVKQIVFKGFQDLSTTQLRVSHPTLAIDNWIYLTSGLTAAKVTSPSWSNREPVFLNRVDGRFRPGTTEIEETAGSAQFGQTFDAFGRRFICSNRNHIQHVVMESRYMKRNPHMSFSQVVEDIPDHGAACKLYPLSANITTAASHAGFFTSACGVTIYNGTALPEKYRGNSFTCEPAANLIHHDVLEPNGAMFVAKRMYPTNEFLASPDNWFRPVNLAVGPDGALYVCDMYRKTIEHPEYLPEATRKVTDFESGKDKGRIYRVVADRSQKSEVRSQKFDLSKASVKELCKQLENPNSWWRFTAHRLLLERNDKSAAPVLKSLVQKSPSPEARVHALHILKWLGVLEEELLSRVLLGTNYEGRDRATSEVQEHAVQLLEPWIIGKTAKDANPRVRFQSALSFGEFEGDKDVIIKPLASIAAQDMSDKWTRAAVLSSINGRADKFMTELLALKPNSDSMPELMGEVGRILGATAPFGEFYPTLQTMTSSKDQKDFAWQMAAIAGFGDGLKNRSDANGKMTLGSLLLEDSTMLHQQVQNLFQRAAEFAADSKATINQRQAAIRLLNQAEFSTAGATLEKLVDPQQPSEIQIAAVRALGQFSEPQVGAALMKRERWNAYTPTVRDAVLSAVMANTNLLAALFTAIEAGDVPPTGVNEDRRNQLMHHKDEAIKGRATALFKDIRPSDRMKAYEEFKSVLALNGDGKNGHVIFQKTCVTCHTFAGEGHAVGPDLTGIRNQPGEVLLLHILVPEYEIMPIYTAYNVETKDGESATGILVAETPENITLRMASSIEQKIPRAKISSMSASRLSLMPTELEKTMTKQELADLLAFLKGQ